MYGISFTSKVSKPYKMFHCYLHNDYRDQIEVLVRGMFEYSGELDRFQDDILDFLIDITEVGDEEESQQRADEELNAELDLLRNS
jgi:hypothetical protein